MYDRILNMNNERLERWRPVCGDAERDGWRRTEDGFLSSAPTIGISCAYTGCDGFARYSERVFGLTGKWGAGILAEVLSVRAG